jgi:hypothetical protein
LFCPELPPPRNRTVSRGASGLERGDIRESIFTHFSGKREGPP